jgi:hypothetical protein
VSEYQSTGPDNCISFLTNNTSQRDRVTACSRITRDCAPHAIFSLNLLNGDDSGPHSHHAEDCRDASSVRTRHSQPPSPTTTCHVCPERLQVRRLRQWVHCLRDRDGPIVRGCLVADATFGTASVHLCLMASSLSVFIAPGDTVLLGSAWTCASQLRSPR